MFDIAYENEASITAAELTKERIWKKFLELDLCKTMVCFTEFFEINRMNNYITYYSIMYYTHGV